MSADNFKDDPDHIPDENEATDQATYAAQAAAAPNPSATPTASPADASFDFTNLVGGQPDNTTVDSASSPLPPPSPAATGAELPARKHAEVTAVENQALVEQEGRSRATSALLGDQVAALHGEREQSAQWDLVDAMQSHLAEQQASAKQLQKDIHNQALKYQQAVDHFKQFNPDPWADRGTVFDIGMALSALVGGAAAALTGQQNPALQIMDNILHRDLQRQRMLYEQQGANVQNQHTVYSMMRQVYADQDSAMAASWAASKELLTARAKAQLMVLSPQERTLQAQQRIAQLEASTMEDRRKANDISLKNRFEAQRLEDAERAQRQLAAFREGKVGQQSPNMFAAEGLKGQQLTRANQLYEQYVGPFHSWSNVVKTYFQLPVTERLKPENVSAAQSAFAELSQVVKMLKGQGLRFSEKLQELDEIMSSGSKGGVLSKDLKDLLSGGAMQKAFELVNREMDKEFQQNLLTESGRPVDYWVNKERTSIRQLNYQRQIAAGMPGDDE